MIEWVIEKRKIADLIPNPRNPRKLSKHDYQHLKTSIEKFGLIDKPIVTKNGSVIGGHQRVEVLKRMKVKEVECWVPRHVDVEVEEIDELAIRLNRNVGEWDWDILANEWDTGDLLEWGFTEGEFALNIEAEPEDEAQGVPEVPKTPITKLGDLYELGDHKVICGDCTKKEISRKVSETIQFSILLTDPPYNFAKENKIVAQNCSKAMKKLKNSEWDKDFDVNSWLMSLNLDQFKNSSLYIFTSHHLAGDIWAWMSSWADHHSWCIWEKPNPMPSLQKRHWTWNGELICYATKGKHIFNFPYEGHAPCIWNLKKQNGNTDHPTQKPAALFEHIIKHSSKESANIYDPFLGSGTTLIACEQLNRKCFGIEIAPEYCDVIVRRWLNYRKQQGQDAPITKNGKKCKEFDAA